MLNLLNKTKPWMVASLLVATSVFAQDTARQCPPKGDACKPCPKPCPQPQPPTQMCAPAQSPCCPPWAVPVLNAAYNYPARTITRCAWDVFFDASFIYWQPLQENMELGVSVPTTGAANVINQNASYKPGFKVGLGGNFDYDNWDLKAEYTWFHNTQTTNVAAATGGTIAPISGGPVALATDYANANQQWRLKMDIAELLLGRWHYVGTKLTMHPTFGARAAWIRQNNNLALTGGAVDATVSESSTSWAIGPQAGLDTNFMLGDGFRFYGNGEVDVLFTRYNRLSSSYAATASATVNQAKVNTLRTHLDLELGFGWGTYLDCNNWYMDFSAGYGFQVFFDQNMFRNFTSSGSYDSFSPNGNLYVQGLNVTFRLDF